MYACEEHLISTITTEEKAYEFRNKKKIIRTRICWIRHFGKERHERETAFSLFILPTKYRVESISEKDRRIEIFFYDFIR